MAPEQCDSERGAAIAIGLRIGRRAGFQKNFQRRERGGGNHARICIGGVVQRGPALVVRQVGIGAGFKQVMHDGGETQSAEAAKILAETRRSLYRILAEDEPAEE